MSHEERQEEEEEHHLEVTHTALRSAPRPAAHSRAGAGQGQQSPSQGLSAGFLQLPAPQHPYRRARGVGGRPGGAEQQPKNQREPREPGSEAAGREPGSSPAAGAGSTAPGFP